jgi:GcrA cell cycle regulator
MVTIVPVWTAERVELLKSLFERGRTCREIANEIGLSRNAVIGKISRLKLSRPNGRSVRRPQREAGPRVGQRVGPPRGARALQLLLALRAAPPPEVDTTIPDGPCRSLLELGNEQCRWPVGDVQGADSRFCANPVVDGLPYCAGHARLAYRPSSRRYAAPR